MRFTLLFKLCNVQKKLHRIRGRETNQSYAGYPPVYTPNLRTLECKSVITAALWRFFPKGECPLSFEGGGGILFFSAKHHSRSVHTHRAQILGYISKMSYI